MRHIRTIFGLVLTLAILLGPAPQAATPPGLVNYQGVLRDAADKPLDGDHDMVFRFFNAETGGDEILIDRHTATDSEAVTVTGGLFSVRLGAGAIQDGSGPGTWTSLAQVFADLTEVWLRVEVGGEALDPRVRVVAAPYAINADRLDGRQGSGFIDTTSTSQSKGGPLTINSSASGQYGLQVYSTEGAYFEDSDQSGQAWIANGNWGVGGKGNVAGGSFEDRDDSGYAYVGVGHYGIEAYGALGGGHFEDTDSNSYAVVGVGGHGILAHGSSVGGSFNNLSYSGLADVASEDHGIEAWGDAAGGYFADRDGSGYARVGVGNLGIMAYGTASGGHFSDSDASGLADVGSGDIGIFAMGDLAGGRFHNSVGGSYADVGREDYGIRAYGNVAGGDFTDLDSSGYAKVGYSTYKIQGAGAVSFVQNHPEQSDRVIVYAAPEGDEVATYTRGTARLSNGEARVALGETFRWVTNPDIGLTAHLTPHGDCRGLYVESLTTAELVVREREGGTSDAVFDFLVYGLRIGFEETSVVQEKSFEAFTPSMKDHRDRFEQHTDLQRFNALERFKTMAATVDGREAVDLSRADALKAKIQEYDPEVHGPVDQLLGHGPPRRDPENPEAPSSEVREINAAHAESVLDAPELVRSPIVGATLPRGTDRQTRPNKMPADEFRGDPLPASAPVEVGEVLAFDPEHPGMVRAAITMADPGVIGVAVGMADDTLEARVVATGFVECKVDAGYGAIRAGDLLTTSPTPGHAMRALDVLPGTILGKALEPLELGTGTIQILVNPR